VIFVATGRMRWRNSGSNHSPVSTSSTAARKYSPGTTLRITNVPSLAGRDDRMRRDCGCQAMRSTEKRIT
jgi:hypothetical protein